MLRIYTFLPVLVLLSCSLGAVQPRSIAPADAYRQGHYRAVVEQLGSKKTPTPLDYYLLAQSQLELRRTNDAWLSFNKINAEAFASSKDTAFLYPYYVDGYLVAGFARDQIGQPAAKNDDILTMAARVSGDHPAKGEIDDRLLAFLWKEKNYAAMMIANSNLSPQGKVWIELAKFAQGLPYNLDILAQSWKAIKTPAAYADLLASVNPKTVASAQQAKSFAEISLAIPDLQSKALEFAGRYELLSKDSEFPVLIQYQILASKGDLRAAAKFLYDKIKAAKGGSLALHRLAQSQLIRREMLDEALELAEIGYRRHGEAFSTEYNTVLESKQKPAAILAWYRKNYRRSSEEMHNQVFRAMIRTTNLKLAEEALDLGYAANSNFASFHLMNALVKQRLGKEEAAYKSYLRAVLLEPFGYPGIAARPRELELRPKYRKIFDAESARAIPLLTGPSLPRRLLTAKAFLIDPELKDKVNLTNFRLDQAEHDALVLRGLEIEPIPALEKIDLRLTNYGPEIQAFAETAIQMAARTSKTPAAAAKYYYKYRRLFLDSEITGYLTFRLFFYLRDLYGNNTYLPIFSKEMMGYVYPKLEWDFILQQSGGSEDLAYWMMSSFHQESHFRKRVFSQVGAVGFAQVMGYTAQDIKGWMKRPFMENTDFVDNLTMGIYYHNKMYEIHGNNQVYGMAAYNAGPHRVKRWRASYAPYEKDMALFIEAIDIRETRIYVRIVSYNRFMYELIDKHPELWL